MWFNVEFTGINIERNQCFYADKRAMAGPQEANAIGNTAVRFLRRGGPLLFRAGGEGVYAVRLVSKGDGGRNTGSTVNRWEGASGGHKAPECVFMFFDGRNARKGLTERFQFANMISRNISKHIIKGAAQNEY